MPIYGIIREWSSFPDDAADQQSSENGTKLFWYTWPHLIYMSDFEHLYSTNLIFPPNPDKGPIPYHQGSDNTQMPKGEGYWGFE